MTFRSKLYTKKYIQHFKVIWYFEENKYCNRKTNYTATEFDAQAFTEKYYSIRSFLATMKPSLLL